jgi:imidazole glycerol-phosphate synthase subunit HisH
MISIIDYGMGNLRSVEKALQMLGHDAEITADSGDIESADGVVLPGVGAFGDCMANLESTGLKESTLRAIGSGKPFLGICLGLQLLFEESEEDGQHPGLGIMPGRVRRFPPKKGLKVPHMGWNQLRYRKGCPLYKGVDEGSYVYFVHSYYVDPEEIRTVATTTTYGHDFVSIVQAGNVFACQFHPEKSGSIGLKIFDNFAKLCKG